MNFGILLCGGTGTRMGKDFLVPKQYIKVNDKRIFSYSLTIFDNNKLIDEIIVCADVQWQTIVKKIYHEMGGQKHILFAEPGETRQMSVYNSLKIAKQYSQKLTDLAVIHDGARPMVDDDILDDCIRVANVFDGAIATIPVNDTIYQSENGSTITNIPKRDMLRAGQTPEAFQLHKYLQIHDNRSVEEINCVTGGAEFAANNGMKIGFSKGKITNLKITTKRDLESFLQMVDE